jgi:hypothetical protein
MQRSKRDRYSISSSARQRHCDAERLGGLEIDDQPLQKIIVDAEAQTTAGLRAKASVLVEWFFDESDSDNESEPTQYEKLVSDVVNGIASQDWQQGRMV